MAALLAAIAAGTEILTTPVSAVPALSASAMVTSRTPPAAPPTVAPTISIPPGSGQGSVATTVLPGAQAAPAPPGWAQNSPKSATPPPVLSAAPATPSSPPPAPPAPPAPPSSSVSPLGSLGAAPAASVAPIAKSVPVRIQIPAIQVDSTLTGLGLQNDGTMQLPPTGFPAGWYTGAPTPGELGPAIITGHVDWGGHPGVFYDLRHLTPGAQITVTRADGTTAVFRVSRVQTFPKDAFPTATVYGNLDHPGLRLITCGGSFDHAARSYVDNIIAFADLTATHTP